MARWGAMDEQAGTPAGGNQAAANIELIRRQFDAFAVGDMSVALASLSEDVDWQAPVTGQDCSLPWAGRRRGRAAVREYFDGLGASVRPEPFQDLVFTAGADRVIVEGRNAGTVLATGRCYEHAWAMVFTITDGHVVRFRHYYDPADIQHAFTA